MHDDTPTTAAWREALDAWATAARARRGDAPTAEELLDLRAGRLDPEDAERLHDRLAEDPELADLYLELGRAEAPIDPADDREKADLDAAWAALDRRIARRRPWLLGLAALLTVTVGVLLWRAQAPGRSTAVPPGYHRLDVPLTGTRDARVAVPADAAGLAFAIVLDPPPVGPVTATLLDAEDREVHRSRWRVDAEGRLVVPVPVDRLQWGRTYRWVLTRDDAPPIEWILTPSTRPP
ncbi:MAG: hypothetical protein AAGE94_15285 [Acidobacteriota bacterium]